MTDKESLDKLDLLSDKLIEILRGISSEKNNLSIYEVIYAVNEISSSSKKIDQFTTNLIRDNFDQYQNEERESKYNDIRNKSVFVYTLALFERFRLQLLKDAFKYSTPKRTIFKKNFAKKAKEELKKNNDSFLYDIYVNNEDEIPNYYHRIREQGFRAEKEAYGVYEKNVNENYGFFIDKYIVAREMRNMLIHRGDKFDKQILNQIRTGITKNKRGDDKYLDDLLSPYTKNKIKFNDIKEGDRVIIHSSTLTVLVGDILSLAYVFTINAFHRLPKDTKEKIADDIVTTLNDILSIYHKNLNFQSLQNAVKIISLVRTTKFFQYLNNHDVFKVNVLLIRYEIQKYLHILATKFDKKQIKTPDWKKSIKEINNPLIKNIVQNYIFLDINKLISSLHEYALSEKIESSNTFKDWYMIKSVSSIPAVRTWMELNIKFNLKESKDNKEKK